MKDIFQLVFFSPWSNILFFALILLLLYFVIIIIVKATRKMRYKKRGWQEYKIDSGDNTITLSGTYNISWERLVKVNNIKSPYALTPGSIILVPPQPSQSSQPSQPSQPSQSPQKVETEAPRIPERRRENIFKQGVIAVIAIFGSLALASTIFLFIISARNSQTYIQTSPASTIPAVIENFENEIEQKYLQRVQNDANSTLDDEETIDKTPAEVSREKSEISLSVLNGNGVVGFAGKMAALLKEQGFTNIEADNADSYEYSNLIINYQEGYGSLAQEVARVLESEYGQNVLKEVELQDRNIVVILGAN